MNATPSGLSAGMALCIIRPANKPAPRYIDNNMVAALRIDASVGWKELKSDPLVSLRVQCILYVITIRDFLQRLQQLRQGVAHGEIVSVPDVLTVRTGEHGCVIFPYSR